jgi:uncharacterized RDD family membrane protein YckC
VKCPKCGYIGFETSDRCRNCGYEFALAVREPEPAPLAVASPSAEDGPLADLVLTSAPLPAERRRGTSGRELDLDRIIGAPEVSADLPLFDAPLVARERPIAPRAPAGADRSAPHPTPRRPLSVRRPTPDPARFRSLQPEPGTIRNLELPLPAGRTEDAAAGIVAEPEYAQPRARLLAALTDAGLLLGINGLVLYFTLRLCSLGLGEVGELPLAPLIAFFVLLDGGYLLAFTAATGQTIGKMAFGLKVVGLGGTMSPFAAALRSAGCLLSAVMLGAGLVPALLGGRALHDRLAGTAVVHVRE